MTDPKVLLAVDVQTGFVTEDSRHVVAPLAKIQHRFDHAVFTRFYNPDPSPFRRILHYDKMGRGDPDTALALVPRGDAVIMERALYSCVTDEFLDYLREWNATEVFIAGIATEACVLKTVIDLFEKDITPWVLKDLCASDKGAEFHDPAMKVISKLIDPGHIIHSSECFGEQPAQ